MTSANSHDPPQGQTYCWRDRSRVCGGDCQAFDLAGQDESGDLSYCKFVNALHLGAKAFLQIARVYKEAVENPKVTITGSDVPPPPVGGA